MSNGDVKATHQVMNTVKGAVDTVNNGNRATSTVNGVAGAMKGAVTAWNGVVAVSGNPWNFHPHIMNTAGTTTRVIRWGTSTVHQVTVITATLRIVHLPATVPTVQSPEHRFAPFTHCSHPASYQSTSTLQERETVQDSTLP